jgi:hypothetical protein
MESSTNLTSVAEIAGKGRGVVALQPIEPSTVVHSASGFEFIFSDFFKWRKITRSERDFDICTQDSFDCYIILQIIQCKNASPTSQERQLFNAFDLLFPSLAQIQSGDIPPTKIAECLEIGELFCKHFPEHHESVENGRLFLIF